MLAGSSLPLPYPILLSKQSTYSSSLPLLKLPSTAMATWIPTTSAAERRGGGGGGGGGGGMGERMS